MSGWGGFGGLPPSNNNNPFGGGSGGGGGGGGSSSSGKTTNDRSADTHTTPFMHAPFGASSQSSSFPNSKGGLTFGSSPNVLSSSSSGNNFGAEFGSQNRNTRQQQETQQQQQQQQSSFGSPFPQTQQQSFPNQNPLTFGSSSNVIVGNINSQSRGNSGFGNSSYLESKGDNCHDNSFGRGAFVSNQSSHFDGRSGTTPTLPLYNNMGLNITGENSMGNNDDNNSKIATNRTTATGGKVQTQEDKLQRLQAILEEKKAKKKLLEERQRRKREEEEAGRRSKSPTTDQQQQSQTLAERNKRRFAPNNNLLSSSTSTRVSSPATTTVRASSTGREDLHQAVNLVGTCMTMCPVDELEERRNESNIQALEQCMPGRLHPPNWTLKETAVKRLRRSAADYKLDVPSWVRPPDVLEQTMGYLEEWVIERDRQGLDPRFPQPNIPPPSLDVYQFIWDRTRMIRKDFILQNYVGSGGKCDARAVRCHERIARWHAMCEHQLSHISDFVLMQSQQNVQELNQTIKTLNGLYDDDLNRSTVEVPDERTGRETYKSEQSIVTNDTVQGCDPVDYNGDLLNNISTNKMITRRLICKNSDKAATRGTAEPEMRGIYILLFMKNEMEVLKYASRLFKERPAVYHSIPVQLALSIFQAKKDKNYASFFSIMRSSSTPYLFCCIMFTYVEETRKEAFQIMYKAYGARNASGGVGHDQYPLAQLVNLLCFEDLDECRNACNHFNIKIKNNEYDGKIIETICWKRSKFRERKDPEKGVIVPLPPRKMIRTIESKLNKATRLGICRGEVSGEGAALASPVNTSSSDKKSTSPVVPINSDLQTLFSTAGNPRVNDLKAIESSRKHELEKIKLEKLTKDRRDKERREYERQKQEEMKIENERRMQEIEKQKLAEIESHRREEKLKEDNLRRKQMEDEERKTRQREQEEAQRIAKVNARKKAEEIARKRKDLEERERREKDEQENRKKRELEQRLAEERRRKEIEEIKRRKREDENRRLEAIRIELEIKQRREAEEEKQKIDEWRKNIDAATKLLVLHRLRRTLSRPIESSVGSRQSLRAIDPMYKTDSFKLVDTIQMAMRKNRSKIQVPTINSRPKSTDIIEKLLQKQKESAKIEIADMAVKRIESSIDTGTHVDTRKTTLLLKIVLICPETDFFNASFASLLCHWVNTKVKLGQIEIARSRGADFATICEVRSVLVRGSSFAVCASSDIALFVISPFWTDSIQKVATLGQISSSILREDIPRIALVLSDDTKESRINTISNAIAHELRGNTKSISIIRPERLSIECFQNALFSAFNRTVDLFVHDDWITVNRISAMHLANKIILAVLWKCDHSVSGVDVDVDEDVIVEYSRIALRFLIQELANHAKQNKAEWSMWPAPEFVGKNNCVESYFTDNEGLPQHWCNFLELEFLEDSSKPLLTAFHGRHFRNVYQRIIVDAPIDVQDDCAKECAQGQYRRCLEKSLLWMQSASTCCYLYLPEGMIELIMNNVVTNALANPVVKETFNYELVPLLTAESPPYGKSNNSISFPSNKRSRTKNAQQLAQFDSKRHRVEYQEDDNDRTVNLARENRNMKKERTTTVATNESDMFTKKLERLLRGDETIEVMVGKNSLSHILKDVPKI